MDIKPENGVMMVARLDGPSPEIAMRLVDQAMEAEREGLWGRAYFDSRGFKPVLICKVISGFEALQNGPERLVLRPSSMISPN